MHSVKRLLHRWTERLGMELFWSSSPAQSHCPTLTTGSTRSEFSWTDGLFFSQKGCVMSGIVVLKLNVKWVMQGQISILYCNLFTTALSKT